MNTDPLIGPRDLIEKMNELAAQECGVPGPSLESRMATEAAWREPWTLPPSTAALFEEMRRAFAIAPSLFPLRPTNGDKLRSACRRAREQGKTLAGTKEWKRLQRHRKRTGDRSPLYIPIYTSEVVWMLDETTEIEWDELEKTSHRIDALKFSMDAIRRQQAASILNLGHAASELPSHGTPMFAPRAE